MQNRLKRSLKWLTAIALIDLIYLNILVPVTLSVWQIYLTASLAARVCDKQGIDVSTLTSDQLDDLITLSINSVKPLEKMGFVFY